MANRSELHRALEEERAASMLRQAEMIRDCEEGPDRTTAAIALIRESLVSWATGRITHQTESKLYRVLQFAMPTTHNEEKQDYEAAYREQLERLDCPDCGDGRCHVDDP